MIDLALTYSQRRAYESALRYSHAMRVAIHVLDPNEKVQASLTSPESMVIDGAVTIDTTRDVKRSLSLTLVDPRGRLQLDPDSPKPHTVYPGSMLYVVRGDYVPALGRFVDCPVFWGPVTYFKRSGSIVELQGLGKEMLALNPRVLWTTKNYNKGTAVTAVIRSLLAEQGETRFHLPTMTERIPNKMSCSRHQEAWAIAQILARAHHRQLFYDGRGRAMMRHWTTSPAMTFYAHTVPGAPPSTVLPSPDRALDFFTDTRNVQEVLGPEPPPHHYRVRGLAYAHRGDALGPWRQARNGQPAWMVETTENDKLKRNGQAGTIAQRQLRVSNTLGEDVDFEVLPMPHLEEGDIIRLVLAHESLSFRLTQFTIPLRASGTMHIGSVHRKGLRRSR